MSFTLKCIGAVIEKKEIEPVCVCDCIPCKTDSCERCELPTTHGGINALCNEECNSDYVTGYNQGTEEQASVRLRLNREKLAEILFTEKTGVSIVRMKEIFIQNKRDFDACECDIDSKCIKCLLEECYTSADAIIAAELEIVELDTEGR
jgi:hypothetical protein